MEVLGKPDELHNGAYEAESPKGDIFLSQDQINDINFYLKDHEQRVTASAEAREWLDKYMDDSYFEANIRHRLSYVNTKLAATDYEYTIASRAMLKLISKLSSAEKLELGKLRELEEPFEDFVTFVSGVENPFQHMWNQEEVDNTRLRVGDLWRPDEPNKFPNRWRDRKLMEDLIDAIDTKKLGWLADVDVVYVNPLLEFGVLLRESIAEKANLEIDAIDAIRSCASRYTHLAIEFLKRTNEQAPHKKKIGSRLYRVGMSEFGVSHLVAIDETYGMNVHFIDSQMMDYSSSRHARMEDCKQFLQDILEAHDSGLLDKE